jgi:hypothetical protein
MGFELAGRALSRAGSLPHLKCIPLLAKRPVPPEIDLRLA